MFIFRLISKSIITFAFAFAFASAKILQNRDNTKYLVLKLLIINYKLYIHDCR